MTTSRITRFTLGAGLLASGGLVLVHLFAEPPATPPTPVAPEPLWPELRAIDDEPDVDALVSEIESETGGFDNRAVPISIETALYEAVILQGGYAAKKEAIRELKRLGTAEAVEVLSLALSDPDPRIRSVALEALAKFDSDEAIAAIGSLATDRDPRVRADATLALGEAGGDSAVEYLKLALYDADPLVRTAAINSFGDVADDTALWLVQQALQDPDEDVRERALEVLDELEGDAAFRVLYPLVD